MRLKTWRTKIKQTLGGGLKPKITKTWGMKNIINYFLNSKKKLKLKKNWKFYKMTRDMYGDGVNVNLMAGTKLNLFKELEDKIEPKNNKGNKLGHQNSN